MKFSINIEIELSDEEINFLKSKFLPNRGTYNVVFENVRAKSINIEPVVKTLSEKGVIVIDNIARIQTREIGIDQNIGDRRWINGRQRDVVMISTCLIVEDRIA